MGKLYTHVLIINGPDKFSKLLDVLHICNIMVGNDHDILPIIV